jgi:hypothetical protein
MADIFDQLASGQGATTASPGQSPQPQPQQQAQPQQAQSQSGGGDIFDQLSAGASPSSIKTPANQPSVSSTAQPSQQSATISATPGSMPGDPLAAKVKLWSQNVQSDLMHGTDITGVGRVLKAMGAHGFQYGTSDGAAKFMGSLPLGLLRTTQGGAELAQPGQRWAGTKDTVGGLLDASQIPGSFMAPEAGELAGQGADVALTQAERAAKAISAPFSPKAVQPKIQGAITTAIQQAAKDHGIALPDATSIRDIAQTLSDAVRAKAHAAYQQLDAALGGTRFQTYDEQLGNIQRAIRDSLGIDPAKDAALAKRLQDVTAARDAAMDQIRAAGKDPDGLIGQADALHRQAMALADVSKAVRASTDVHPSLAAEATNATAATPSPANVRTAPLFKRMQQLATPNPKYPGTPSRLVQALGEDRAAELLNAVDSAHLAAQKIAARNAWLKRGATAVGLYGLGREAFNGAHELLSGGQ